MTDDDTVIFSEDEREMLCLDENCVEHGDGQNPCEIPTTKREAKAQLRTAQRNTSAGVIKGRATPKTATGKVVRSDE